MLPEAEVVSVTVEVEESPVIKKVHWKNKWNTNIEEFITRIVNYIYINKSKIIVWRQYLSTGKLLNSFLVFVLLFDFQPIKIANLNLNWSSGFTSALPYPHKWY